MIAWIGRATRMLLGGLLLTAAPLAAQQGRELRGRVTDDRGTALRGASVVALSGARTRVLTGADGGFRLRVAPGETRLVASSPGWAADTVRVAPGDSVVHLRLRPGALALDPLIVNGERSLSAASSGRIRELDLHLRPRESSQALLQLVPGLVIAQHAGGGKAEQIFLRGFDADHGTDVAISVDGTPVNMVSHAHGQGYSDLHFLIPEVVERVEVRKGPYDPRDGDFATAGAVSFRTLDRLPTTTASVRGGSFGTLHGLAMLPLGGDRSRPGGYLALSAAGARGFYEEPQHFRRLNAFAKWTAPLTAGTELVASLSGFAARWDASGQLPERSVRAGTIGRFGAIDPTEGGATERYDASLALRSRSDADAGWEVRLFAARYRFDLFSNFTFFLADTVNGDGIQQVDRRHLGGGHARLTRALPLRGRRGELEAGLGARADWADLGLHQQRERVRLAPRTDDRVVQGHWFGWGSYDLHLTPRARLQLGVRGDALRFDVEDRLHAHSNELPRASGVRWHAVLSPKANLALELDRATTLFVNAGSGFHSNHARDAILAAPSDRVLPRALGAELGARRTWTGGSVAVAAWGLDLESELIYVGDEGVTEPSGRTRRFGTDLELRARLLRWLWADADLSLARGWYRDLPRGENLIPLAPRVTSTGGLVLRDLGPVEGGIRFRHVGDRAADETGTVTAYGHTLGELFASWRWRGAEWFATVDNLLDARWNEAQFATTSRLPGEPLEGITELHFTPGAPRSVQLGLRYRF